MNTCVSALKSQHEPRTFLYPDTEGLGCQASPRLSLWTDGLLLRQLRSEVKGLGFRRAREEGVSQAGTPRPRQASPGHSRHPVTWAGAGLGPWCWARGWRDYFLALFLGCGETLAQLPCTLPGPPTTSAK